MLTNDAITMTTARSRVDELHGTWWLLHTRPRNEKALARDLDAVGLRYFLPMARVPRRYQNRNTIVELPLFPGYLFLCGSNEDRYGALRTKRIVKVIDVADQQGLRGELRSIERVTESAEPIDVYPGIQVGRRCRVIRGTLEGVEGVVIRRRGICRVYVAVDILGQSVEVEVDPSILEVLD